MTASQTLTNRSVFTPSKAVRSWLVCLSASLFFFYEFIQMHMFSAISPFLMQDFGLNASELGMLSSTYLFADTLVLLPAGIILDRYSTRTVILSALFVCILGTAGFASTHSFYLAAFYHFLSGIGNGFCFLSCMMLASRWFPPQRRAFVIGIIVTVAMIGGVVAQVPFSYLTEIFGWRETLFFDAILGMLIFALIWWQVSDAPEDELSSSDATQQQNQQISFWISLKLAMKNPQNWLCGIYTSLLNLPIMLLGALWGTMYLSQMRHISMTQAGIVTTMIFIGTILGSPLLGWLSDHFEFRRPPMIICAIASLAVMFLIINVPTLSYTALLVMFLLLGFFTSAQVITYPMVAESNPAYLTGTALGFSALLIMGGAAIAQPLFGFLMDLHSTGVLVDGIPIYTAADFNLALSIIPIGFMIGLVAILMTRETNCKNIAAGIMMSSTTRKSEDTKEA